MLPALLGLGLADDTLDKEIDGFLLAHPKPSAQNVADFLKLYIAGDQRTQVAHALLAKGVTPEAVSGALSWLEASSRWDFGKWSGYLTLVSAAACGFHGYRRNQSVMWAAVWFGMGLVFPIFTPVIALAQGFGKRKAA